MAIKAGKGDEVVDNDEQPFKANLAKIPTLKPRFDKDGTVTAANSTSISDGAAALVMMRRSSAEKRGLAPARTVVGHTSHSQEPDWFTTAPVGAIRKLLRQDRLDGNQVDLYESQRSVCSCHDGGDEGARSAARQGERARRRMRTRASDRRLRRAHRGNAVGRAAQLRSKSVASQACASVAAKRQRWGWKLS